jgi:choline dehydrogenase
VVLALGTPELLIRSGIGDPAQLRALGVDPVACLPGVGRNLQDHPLLCGVQFLARHRLGLVTDDGGGALMNWRSSRARRPDLHAFVVQGPHAGPGGAAPDGLAGDPRVFAICPALLGSVSRGRLTVRDPEKTGPDSVEIDAGFLAERADLDTLAEALDTIMDLAATAAYAELIDKPLLAAAVGFSAREKEAFVREHCSTSFHPCGTAAMGTGSDAVTDPGLNVIGVAGLRVADASVIPVIPAGDIQAAVVAVAERAADLITGKAARGPAAMPVA